MQTIACYNVSSSVMLVFSMLSLGRILLSDLVVTNLLVYSLPGMILLYLAVPFLHWKCFCMRLLYSIAQNSGKENWQIYSSISWQSSTWVWNCNPFFLYRHCKSRGKSRETLLFVGVSRESYQPSRNHTKMKE